MTLECHRLGEPVIADRQPHLGAGIEGRPPTDQPSDPRGPAETGPQPRPRSPLLDEHGQPAVRPDGLNVRRGALRRRRPFLRGCVIAIELHRCLGTRPQIEQRGTLRFAVETDHVQLRRREFLPQADAGPVPRDPQTESPGGRDCGDQSDPQQVAAGVPQHLPVEARRWFVGNPVPHQIGQFSRC